MGKLLGYTDSRGNQCIQVLSLFTKDCADIGLSTTIPGFNIFTN